MEEFENELVVVEEQRQPSKEEKNKKSLNRRFGFLLGFAILLGIILIYEIVLLFV